jgi:RNA polymerase sigma-70 factor (ECF subfamily)
MSSWLQRVTSAESGFERDIVDRYSQRLMALARRRLPDRLRGRVDPEDVVQSVYRSFFRRLADGRFQFEASLDLWRLLAAMTFYKVRNAIRFHQRERRDVRRETSMEGSAEGSPYADPTPGPEDLVTFLECLEQLLARAPKNYREIVVLRLEGLSIAEIAERIDRSQRTVLRALSRLGEVIASELETSA